MKGTGEVDCAQVLHQVGPALQPLLHGGGAAEARADGERAHGEKGHKFHQGFEGNGHDQSVVTVSAGALRSAEQDREQGDDDAENHRDAASRGFRRKNARGVRYRANLQGDDRSDRGQGQQGHQGSRPARAISECDQVGQ